MKSDNNDVIGDIIEQLQKYNENSDSINFYKELIKNQLDKCDNQNQLIELLKTYKDIDNNNIIYTQKELEECKNGIKILNDTQNNLIEEQKKILQNKKLFEQIALIGDYNSIIIKNLKNDNNLINIYNTFFKGLIKEYEKPFYNDIQPSFTFKILMLNNQQNITNDILNYDVIICNKPVLIPLIDKLMTLSNINGWFIYTRYSVFQFSRC